MKQTANMLMVLLLSIIFFSCKKNHLETREDVTIGTYPVKKIFAWLDAEKVKVPADSAKLVEVLKENLRLEEISEEKLTNSQSLVIIPLKNDFKTANSTELQTFKKLILTVNNNEIIKGHIVELIPRGDNRIKTSLSSFINKQAVGFNGIASNLSIFGRFVSEDVYKDGKLYSTSELVAKAKTKKISDSSYINSQNLISTICYDWYIITTYFNYDGSVAFKTYEYIGTSCTGSSPCSLNRIITNTRSYFKSCEGSETGGGGYSSGGGGDNSNPCSMTDAEADQILNGLIGSETGSITYINGGGEINSFGTIREPVTVSFPIFSLQFSTGYWIRYYGQGSGIRYKLTPTDRWKWESFQKSSQVTKDNIYPACWSDDMIVTTSNPVFSTDLEKATLAVSYNLTLGLSCLGGQKLKNFKGSHPAILDANQ